MLGPVNSGVKRLPSSGAEVKNSWSFTTISLLSYTLFQNVYCKAAVLPTTKIINFLSTFKNMSFNKQILRLFCTPVCHLKHKINISGTIILSVVMQ